MQSPKLLALAVSAMAASTVSSPVVAQGLVAYYQVGADPASWVKWNTHVIDSDSLVREGAYLRYKSFIITANGSSPPQEVKADCKTGKHGLASGASMYDTYPGTIDGEEVRAACVLAERRGLLKDPASNESPRILRKD